MEIFEYSLKELLDKISNKEITLEEIINNYLNEINKKDGKIKAFNSISIEKEKDFISEREKGVLKGIPIAIKDNISTSGFKTTCSSKILENYLPPYDATVVKKLKENGALILGKTNMDEFAMGSSTENSAFKSTNNPWKLGYAPGGSSGGSAAAVAAMEAPAALGSDTGGSIRQPAAFCGVVGLKPTYGMVSRYGLVAFASSLDQIGPITRDVRDAALLMNIISGHDPLDSTSVDKGDINYESYLKEDVKGLKVGIPAEYFNLDFNAEIKENILSAAKKMEDAGAEVSEVKNMTDAEYALAAYYIIAPAEASSNLARYDGVRYGLRSEEKNDIETMFINTRHQGFGPEVKRRIMLGTYVLSSGYYDDFYLKAQKIKTLIKDDFDRVFKDYDILITPTTPTTAFKLGEMKDPLEMYHADIFTVPVNIAGIPAISIPSGFDTKGLPIGLQIMGPHFGEAKILHAAYALEKMLEVNKNRPEMEV